MKFKLQHTFYGITLEAYEKLFFDETFNTAVMPIAELKTREVMVVREENGIVHRETRVVPVRDFPPPLSKLIKGGELSYIEIADFDAKNHSQKWTTKINVLPDKIKMGGDIFFKAVDGGVERTVTGECSVSVFGIGGMIEKIIVDNLEQTYGKVARFTQSYIEKAGA